MTDWRKPCEHGRYDSHPVPLVYVPDYYECPGGSPVTVADLEGETVWWCAYGTRPIDGVCIPTRPTAVGHGVCGWRLLIPIPDLDAE